MFNINLLTQPEDIFHWGIKALVRNSQGHILLMEEIIPSGLQWDLPGGRIHKNSSPEKTLRRELYEETGINDCVILGEFLTCLSKNRIHFKETDVGLILTIYKVTIPEKSVINLSQEHERFAWKAPKLAAKLLRKKFSNEFCRRIADLENIRW